MAISNNMSFSSDDLLRIVSELQVRPSFTSIAMSSRNQRELLTEYSKTRFLSENRMLESPSSFMGMKVIARDIIPDEYPVKSLENKRWHKGRCYNRRINKKWLKRYGTQPFIMLIDDAAINRMFDEMVLYGHTSGVTRTQFGAGDRLAFSKT